MLTRKAFDGVLLLTVVTWGAILNSSAVEAQTPEDVIAQHPAFAEFVKQYPRDWEQRIHPRLRPIVAIQRINWKTRYRRRG